VKKGWGGIKISKIHLFDIEHFRKFPNDSEERWNATKCGYVRKNITRDVEKVTCKLCLKEINKKAISSTYR